MDKKEHGGSSSFPCETKWLLVFPGSRPVCLSCITYAALSRAARPHNWDVQEEVAIIHQFHMRCFAALGMKFPERNVLQTRLDQ
ncbi:hypothetical protein AALO_G00233570 [Alosa alosa]|uniref:Uncharacterized protein n=1 Tax=Alosa alosa TaxID=278164 RepID=A0AAV6FUW7_9TELE|nr:hypothetical protein AALO_G00233570 [Alosa alosa]